MDSPLISALDSRRSMGHSVGIDLMHLTPAFDTLRNCGVDILEEIMEPELLDAGLGTYQSVPFLYGWVRAPAVGIITRVDVHVLMSLEHSQAWGRELLLSRPMMVYTFPWEAYTVAAFADTQAGSTTWASHYPKHGDRPLPESPLACVYAHTMACRSVERPYDQSAAAVSQLLWMAVGRPAGPLQ